jgi:flagella basal body P-ring formation protein FlgA
MKSLPAAIIAFAATTLAAQTPVPGASATDVIRAAVLERLGPDVEVAVTPLGPPAQPSLFRTATPDPSAWLGKPMRFSLLNGPGPATFATVDLRVVAAYAVTTHDVVVGRVLTADDVKATRGELRDLPLRRVPAADALVGARALRAMAAGTTIQSSFVIVRRVVEPGDKVTVVAARGAVEVTATLVAADGGQVGDVIRVVNPETRKYLRGRVLRAGFVEVIHER